MLIVLMILTKIPVTSENKKNMPSLANLNYMSTEDTENTNHGLTNLIILMLPESNDLLKVYFFVSNFVHERETLLLANFIGSTLKEVGQLITKFWNKKFCTMKVAQLASYIKLNVNLKVIK